ncbi:AraC family transcriptional regulator [Lysinibacillus cavernae]|uniref:AraC family transcriptional regulator n=1 Tax=Lysinibacillus cavernae TaxID=2666135 RepID=UPI0012D9DCFD|nr:AraC family transcriptional regulator [Lysinibacillus cavernae]
MQSFTYKKTAGITALKASFTDFKYKKHAHQEYALGVTLKGIQHYYLDGNVQLSHENGVMFFNPEQVHDGMAYNREGLEYVMLYIDPALFLEAIQKKDIVSFEKPIIYNNHIKQQILKLSHAILTEENSARCNELFLHLTDCLVAQDVSSSMKMDSFIIKKAKEIIHSHVENVLKIEDICQELQMTTFQFIRFFKKHTGITPYQYFLNCKVERAKSIIEQTGDIYVAVAQCGYVDLAHLNKQFKCIFGTTAFEYLSFIHNR